MTRLLKALGLMTVREHERASEADEQALRRMTVGRDDWRAAAKDWEAKYKKAITDLAAAREEIAVLHKEADPDIAALRDEIVGLRLENTDLRTQIGQLRPDALAMRRKREMDRERRKGVAP